MLQTIGQPGMASVGNQLMTMCAAAASAGNADLELLLGADDEAACIAVRVPGIDLEATLANACEAIDRIVPDAVHQAERDELMLRLPWNPPDVHGGLALAGRTALADVLSCPRVGAIRMATQRLESALREWAAASPAQPSLYAEFRSDHIATGETRAHDPDVVGDLLAVQAAARALADAVG